MQTSSGCREREREKERESHQHTSTIVPIIMLIARVVVCVVCVASACCGVCVCAWSQVGYGIAKAGTHHLASSLAAGVGAEGGLPKGAVVATILPAVHFQCTFSACTRNSALVKSTAAQCNAKKEKKKRGG